MMSIVMRGFAEYTIDDLVTYVKFCANSSAMGYCKLVKNS